MITLYNLTNTDQFFRVINGCLKPVVIRTKYGSTNDIRGDRLICSLLTDCLDGKEIPRLTIQTESEQDLQSILHFMIQEKAKGAAML